MSARIALGTVQFGLRYGVANQTGQVSPPEVKAILAYAAEAGLDTIDTAIGYGESEVVLGQAGVADWKIVTKLPGLPSDTPEEWVIREVEGSLARLKVSSIHALMLHRPADLSGPQGARLYRALTGLRDTGVVSRIGYSIYKPSELDLLFEAYPADIVQAPLNVFDQRLSTSGWLHRLAGLGVEVHTRSAFLQGLLLLNPDQRPEKFRRWSGHFRRWDNWCDEHAGDRLGTALGAVLTHEGIDRVVVGVDSLAQLREILLTSGHRSILPSSALEVDDEDLINPARWNSI